MINQKLTRLQDFYRSLSQDKISQLADIYAVDVEFNDPLHHLSGLKALEDYFCQLMRRVRDCRFEFAAPLIQQQQAMLRWDMYFVHPQLAAGKPICVKGCSYLVFNEQGLVQQHCDYFDVSAMLHDHLPVLGACSKAFKKRVGKV